MNPAGAELQATAERLRSDRRRFVAATVVRADRPTSAKAGDTALVLDDGSILGFVGGECAQASVQVHALAAMETGEPVLLRISPDEVDPAHTGTDATAGAVTVHNRCLSGGTLEIFLQPTLPPPLVVIHGDAPIARALHGLVEWLGYDVRSSSGGAPSDADAVVVASHGGGEHAVLEAALQADVPYVGLVASRRRGAAVLDALSVTEEDRRRVHTPAGLDIGSRTPEEVALSILAQVIAERPRTPRATPARSAGFDAGAATAVDPVCGMAVATVESARHIDHDGTRYWFCGPGCEDAFRADPGSFARS